MKKQLTLSGLQKKFNERNYAHSCFSKVCKRCKGIGHIKELTQLNVDTYDDVQLNLWNECPECKGRGHLIKSDEEIDLGVLQNLHYYTSQIYVRLNKEKEKKDNIVNLMLTVIEYASYNGIDLDKELKAVL